MRRDVTFEGFGGTVLRGWLYLPEDTAAPVPGIVMAHGFSAVKEMALDRYAEVFCGAGMAALVYDHRNLGASDGEPRQELNPWAQTRDYRRAIGWLTQRPEIDEKRIGIWGSSFSGGEVIVLGACDDRVRAVVANVPLAGYPGVDYRDSAERFRAMREALLDESGAGPADTRDFVFGPLPVVREGGREEPVALDQPESAEWFLSFANTAPSWVNSFTLVNGMGTDPIWDPGQCIAHVAPTPLMLVIAKDDRLADTAVTLASFERAGEPKERVLIDGHHFVPYEGVGFERSSNAARRFFEEHLQGTAKE